MRNRNLFGIILCRKMASDTRNPNKVREKVALKPGFHLRDWIQLTKVAKDLSGLKGENPRKITWSELSEHNTRFDCWMAYKGKVYNVSPYFPYHPGGEEILMQAAGKDCTDLFNEYHRWVNMENLLGKCFIGVIDETEQSEDEQESGAKKIEVSTSTAITPTIATNLEDSQEKIRSLLLSDSSDRQS